MTPTQFGPKIQLCELDLVLKTPRLECFVFFELERKAFLSRCASELPNPRGQNSDMASDGNNEKSLSDVLFPQRATIVRGATWGDGDQHDQDHRDGHCHGRACSRM